MSEALRTARNKLKGKSTFATLRTGLSRSVYESSIVDEVFDELEAALSRSAGPTKHDVGE